MILFDNIADEFRRSPVGTTAALIGLVIAGLALFIAWRQVAPTPSETQTAVGGAAATVRSFSLKHLLLILALGMIYLTNPPENG